MRGMGRRGLLGLAQADNVKQLPWIEDHKRGKAIPVFEIGGFINTLEGWNLYVQCAHNGDMGPYEEAKTRYDEEQRQEAEHRQRREHDRVETKDHLAAAAGATQEIC